MKRYEYMCKIFLDHLDLANTDKISNLLYFKKFKTGPYNFKKNDH